MKKFLPYLKPYIKEIILSPLFKMLEALLELIVPLVIGRIIDTGIANGDTPYIIRQCLLLALFAAVGLGFSVTAQYFAAKAAVGFSGRLRQDMYDRILSLSWNEYDRTGTSALITRMTTDINTMQNGVNLTLRLLLRSPFVVFGAMIMAFTVDVKSAFTFVGVIPLLSVAVFTIILSTIPMYKKVRERLDDVTVGVRRALGGVRVIRAFCKEEEFGRDFEKRTKSLFNAGMTAGRVSALLAPVTYILINLATAVLIYVGAVRVNGGSLSTGSVVVLYNYMGQILVELIKLANLIITITKSIASGKRVASVLDEKSCLTYPEKGATPDENAPALEMDKVCFAYQGAGAEALTDINMTVKKGEIIGIIGATGSGKSTLVSLIPRFYDATKGEIRLFGNDIKDYTLSQLVGLTAVVPQRAVLFSGTIRDNLLFANRSADENTIAEAIENAQASDIIKAKKNGLDEKIEEGGKNLSGGQKQRLTVARALVKKAPVLILDDSASALDAKTDSCLRKAISQLDYKPTVFIVAQRISAVRDCDRIAVLEDGCLAGFDTHENLLKTCSEYIEIYNSQVRGAEK